jgi:AraC family transcriptional regulator
MTNRETITQSAWPVVGVMTTPKRPGNAELCCARPVATIVEQEAQWRSPPTLENRQGPGSGVTVCRWTDTSNRSREFNAETNADHHTIGVVLRQTNLALSVSGRTIHDGYVAPGMSQVSGPVQVTRAIFHAPCDFLHLYISKGFLAECHEQALGRACPDGMTLVDPHFFWDVTIEKLGRALLSRDEAGDAFGRLYTDSICLAIVARLLGRHVGGDLETARLKKNSLQKWRLKRVLDYIEAHLAGQISLQDLANCSGLTRMHFAAQFRAAVGIRPHEYLLRRRIERARVLLAEPRSSLVDVALNVGFQTQSHFTTVFKRCVGDTPHQWRQRSASN